MSDAYNTEKQPVSSTIGDECLPALYHSADKASISAQQRYICLQRWQITCLILGSVGAIIASNVGVEVVKLAYIVSAIVLAILVILTWVSRARRDDKVWFDCRAIAESTKTATWRFMMKATPFKDDSEARKLFIDELRLIREARLFVAQDLAHNLDANAPSISDSMDSVRQKPLNDRRYVYLGSRLRDQKIWYSNKAKFNSRMERRWFLGVLVLQILAVALAIICAAIGSLPVNIVPLVLTSAAAGIAWTRIKRYAELAQSYSLAAQELGDQETIALDITEEADFLGLVEQVEQSISREHTMWCARRNIVLDPTDI